MYSLACKQLHLIDAFDIFYIFAHNSHKQQTNKNLTLLHTRDVTILNQITI